MIVAHPSLWGLKGLASPYTLWRSALGGQWHMARPNFFRIESCLLILKNELNRMKRRGAVCCVRSAVLVLFCTGGDKLQSLALKRRVTVIGGLPEQPFHDAQARQNLSAFRQ
ncbi:unnamed protein product, partial [Ectocarpus sp. 4 AP-2014]